MTKKRVLVCWGVDVDAVAGWLGSYGGENSTSDISRGKLGPEEPTFSESDKTAKQDVQESLPPLLERSVC
jgi:hypothetical protein